MILVFVLLLVSAAPVAAQTAAECPTSECTATAATLNPAHAQVWREAASIHQHKIAFVDGLQRFLRAQAGTFGDEGNELQSSITAMQAALSQWDLTIEQFRSRTSRVARDAESQIAMATVWLDRHRIDAALRALTAAEQFDDSRADLYAMRALAYGASNRPDEAARALRRAAALDSRDPTLAYALVKQLTQLHRSDEAAEARRSLQRALAMARRVAFARVDLLSQAAGTAPIFPQARYAKGFAALESGDYSGALAQFAAVLATDPLVSGPSDERARIAAAVAALQTGRIDVALRQLEDALRASPTSAEVHRVLGVVYWIDEQSGKSIDHLRAAIRLASADERARVLLSDVLAADRRFAEAERELMQANEAGVRSGQIAYRFAQLYQRQSLLPAAANAFQESSSFGPVAGRDRFFQAWGSVLVNQADFDGAVAAYVKRIDVNANSAEAHRQLGEIHFLRGRNDEALAEFSVAVWLDPKDARSHAAAGQVYARLGKWPDAVAALQRALSLDGNLREARYTLGTVLARTGKGEHARRELERFAQQQAEAEAAGQREFQLDALRRQAAKDALAGDLEQALSRYQSAATMDPSPRSYRDLGLTLMRAKRFNEAIAPLLRAQKGEETAEGFLYLADAYAAGGNAEEAARQGALHREFVLKAKLQRVRDLEGR